MQLKNRTAIVIVTYNIKIDVFLLQIEAIRKFCLDNYFIEIIDNSNNELSAKEIKYHSDRLGLPYTKTSATSVNGTDSHVFAANTAYRMFSNKYDYFFFMDHDLIPVDYFSVETILKDKIMAGLGQGTTTPYFWAGCVMFDNVNINRDLINFAANHELKIDTGGELYKVINTYGMDKCTFFDEVICQNEGFTKGFYNFYNLIYGGVFMHFINSSNWNPTENNEERINSLINIAKNKINLVN